MMISYQVYRDLSGIYNAIAEARQEKNKPTIIRLRTTIGYGSKQQGTHGVHGSRMCSIHRQTLRYIWFRYNINDQLSSLMIFKPWRLNLVLLLIRSSKFLKQHMTSMANSQSVVRLWRQGGTLSSPSTARNIPKSTLSSLDESLGNFLKAGNTICQSTRPPIQLRHLVNSLKLC